jgi:hypothetical protein
MTMVEISLEDTLLRGLAWGLAGTLLGSLVFGLIASPLILWEISQTPLPYDTPRADSPADLIDSYLQGGVVGALRAGRGILSSILFGGTIGFIFSALPGVLGGIILTSLVHFGASRLPVPARTGVSIAMGALIGGAIGLLLVTPMSLIPSPDSAMLIMEGLVQLVSLACGGWVGWRLISGCLWIQSPMDSDRLVLRAPSISEEFPILRPLLRGLGWGLMVGVLFNLVFGVVGILFLKMEWFRSIMSFELSLVPALLGGAAFSILLPSLSRARLPTPAKVLLASIVAGGIGLFIAEPIATTFIAFYYSQRLVFRLVEVTLVLLAAVVSGIWVAKRLAPD